MKLVGLISGGKDSIYNMLQCIAAGHEMVAVANIEPHKKEELDSYMYQSVGHEAVSLVAASLSLPIFRHSTEGKAVCKDKTYTVSIDDEVEDLYTLLADVKKNVSIEGVSVGAIASDYQRTRVENVCERLGLRCFAYLWRRDQGELLEEMIQSGLDAIIIKVASIGLKPDFHLGAHIREVKNNLNELNEQYGVNICGEGGEYETLTLDCPLFNKVIKITAHDKIVVTNDPFAPVGILFIKNATLESKTDEDPIWSQQTRTNFIQNNIKNPLHFIQDCLPETSEELIEEKKGLGKSHNLTPERSSGIHFGAQRPLPDSRLKLSQRTPSSNIFLIDTSICNLNYSTGWCFIGNATGATLALTMTCLQKHLTKFEFDFADVIMIELFVRDMTEFASMNNVYSQFVPRSLPPTRICVETCLPPEVGVLANVVAQKCVSKIRKALSAKTLSEKEVIHVQSISHWAPANIGPYSQCIRVRNIYYLAGQIPLIPGNMELLNKSISSQCNLTLRHVLRVMQAVNPNFTYSNTLQAICYVTLEEVATVVVPMWSSITNNINATVTSVVVSQLPRNAELEWQVIACSSDNPKAIEKTETIGDCNVYMKQCVFNQLVTSSLVCKVSHVKKKREHKSDSNMKLEAAENLVTVLRTGINFLIANLQCPGVPLCMLKLFYKFHDSTVTSIINEITKSTEHYKVTASGIPVLGFEEPDVFLTITGICH